MFARADPDRRDSNGISDLLRDIGNDNLEHDGKCSGMLHAPGVIQKLLGFARRFSLELVATFFTNVLRQHSYMGHHWNPGGDDALDFATFTPTTFELHRVRTGIDELFSGFHGLFRRGVSVNRHIPDE